MGQELLICCHSARQPLQKVCPQWVAMRSSDCRSSDKQIGQERRTIVQLEAPRRAGRSCREKKEAAGAADWTESALPKKKSRSGLPAAVDIFDEDN